MINLLIINLNMQKNRFAAAAGFDSDEDVPVEVQKKTKTQVKKEEKKISDKPVKINVSKMAEGGFEVVNTEKKDDASRPVTAGRPKTRGPRTDKPREDRPRVTANNEAAGLDVPNNRERQPFRGKPRQENHPFDR